MPDRGWTAEWEKKSIREVQAAAKILGEGSSNGDSSSTMEVVNDEFGALGVQGEVDNDEDGVEGEEKAKRTRSRNKTKKKKK